MRKCLVTLTLLFSCINTSFALNGLGTQASPWLIQSITDFDEFTANPSYWSGYTRLDTNISLTGKTYTAAPIAPDTDNSTADFQGTKFTGNFNGNSHTIFHLTINGASYLGLFGQINNGSVSNLGTRSVNISGTGFSVGGLCGGNASGTITSCYSTGSITGNEYVGHYIGGLCGQNSGTITNCYFTGSVIGSHKVGGLCGRNSGTITSCYSTGSVTGTSEVGGLCGKNWQTITDCYWDIDASGQTTSDGGWGLTSAQMKQAASYPGWNSGNWTINEGIDTPRLTWQNYPGSIITTGWPTPTYSGSGTEAQPYLIANADDLLCLSRRTPDWSCHFILTADIDLDSLSFGSALIAYGSAFTGTFNGNSHIIRNLSIVGGNCAGLFSRLGYGSQVIDLALEDCDIQGNYYVGGLCGDNDGTITNCYSSGPVTGTGYYIGGLCGENSGTVTNCYSTGFVTSGDSSYYIGGLCGHNYSGTITNCYSTGFVTSGDSSYCIGGLCGYNSNGSITNCYSSGSVTTGLGYDSYSVGGLCGENSNGTIASCYSTGSVTGSGDYSYYTGGLCGRNYSGTITDCYSSGTVTEPGDDSDSVGGLCGENFNGTIASCYSTSTVTDSGDESYYTGGLCGRNFGSITSCYSTGSVDGSDYIGGLCGQNMGGTITSCYSTGHVAGSEYFISAYYVGGLCGENGGSITNCYSTGHVGGPEYFPSVYYVGGLCGRNNAGGSITNCYSTSTVVGYAAVGGLCGYNNSGTITSCYSAGTSTYGYSAGGLCGVNTGSIASCYSTDAVTGIGGYVGGLVGSNNGSSSKIENCYSTGYVTGGSFVAGLFGYFNSGTVTGCFWDTQTSGTADGVGNMDPDPSGVSGKTTTQMQDINTFLTADWDFQNIWHMPYESIGYPMLFWQRDIPGDFTAGYGVTLADFAVFSQAWLTSSGQPDYNEDCDLVNDNTINLTDLTVFAENFLQGL
jgi:hypothetical protein